MRFAVFALLGLLGLTIYATIDAKEERFFTRDGVAIRGYDPVAYFTEGEPVKGSADYALTYQGTVWHFATAAHRQQFSENPEKYLPQYGGYCAYGMSKGYAVETQPDAFAVRDGKLYFNYNREVLRTWIKNPQSYIVEADKHFPQVVEQ